MTRRIAVTGANGFVGRHLVRHAVAAGREVVGLVRSEAAGQTVAALGASPAPVMGDDGALVRALQGAGAVVHLAQIGAERPGATYEGVNVGLTARVVEAARRAGVPRLVLFSGLGVARYGMSRRCTNAYFLSKLAAESLVLRSGLERIAFRPSYVVGPGDAFVPALLRAMAAGEVELAGDGSYRLQPIAVADAAAAVLAAIDRPGGAIPFVFDLVGPEALSCDSFVRRLARAAGRDEPRLRPVEIAEAERRAREGGFLGMLPDELDCLLCDEVSDPAPLAVLIGRPLLGLDEALAEAVRAW